MTTNLSSSYDPADCGDCERLGRWCGRHQPVEINKTTRSWFNGFVVGVALIALFWAVSVAESNPPLLVGIGCAGASGPLYANEEDEFPKCEDIHRVN